MAFSDFVYPDLLDQLALREDSADLFDTVPDLSPSDALQAFMRVNRPLANMMHTEKARSEMLVAPLFSELAGRFPHRLNLHSGTVFSAVPEDGLAGYVDFVVGRGPQLPRIAAPVFLVFEAKRDSIPDGYGQCIAAMHGASRFNFRTHPQFETVYGCVTTGELWKFLRLSGPVVTFDQPQYTIHQMARLLGILAFICVPSAVSAAA